jgi:hypothetical protein
MTDQEWSQRVAGLVADALVQANLLPKRDFARATEIAAEEILVRLCMGDRPPIESVGNIKPDV